YAMAGTVRPSREVLVHEQIYSAFPDTNVILHTHDTIALQSAWRTQQTPRPIFFATWEEARKVVEAFKGEKYVTLPEHGQFVMGKNIDEALQEAERFHWTAVDDDPVQTFKHGGMVLHLFYATSIGYLAVRVGSAILDTYFL
ncbi:MAG: class II aldolase/adducin family protein, partial [Nanoarchaeota archaeon]